MRRLKLGIDVGGTFTDVVAIDQDGKIYFAKTPSTPKDQSIGVVNGIRRILKDLGAGPDEVGAVAHGTTVATNTLLEKNGAVTALITTKGFRDVIDIGRQTRNELYDLGAQKTEPLIPRYLRREVTERTLIDGTILTEVNEEELRSTIRELLAQGIGSLAVSFLHAYKNPTNERRAAEILREEAPGLPISISHDVLPEMREFERTNTTVINAYVRPRMQNYVDRLIGRINEAGVHAPLTIMQSSGGMMTDKVAAEKSVNTLLSGPAGGVLAAEFLSRITEHRNIITGDLGGTSFDVALVQDGKISVASDGKIEGYTVKFPHIDITTIGAGGGSVAWIDAGGALRVGPRSAGAMPGPVCYGHGGREITLTDAHVVLGRVGTRLLSGEMTMDVEAARAVMQETLASPLRMSLEQVAEGILSVADSNMVRAIRVMTVERGIDPRRFILLPYGGAGPMNAVEVARQMQIPKVVVPVAPGNFSAFGLLVAPLRYDESCSYNARQETITAEGLALLIGRLEDMAERDMRRDNVAGEDVRFLYSADVRYVGQGSSIPVFFQGDAVTEETVRGIITDFHRSHEKMYGFAKPQDPVEITVLRLSVLGREADEGLYPRGAVAEGPAEPVETRAVFFRGKWIETPIYDRRALRAGHTIVGPAIIEEQGSTTVVAPGDVVTVDERNNMVIEVASLDMSKAAAERA